MPTSVQFYMPGNNEWQRECRTPSSAPTVAIRAASHDHVVSSLAVRLSPATAGLLSLIVD